jgi:hypothetical protein
MSVDRCVELALAQLTDDVRARFAQDPLATLRRDLALTVTAADHLAEARAAGGMCDGVSFMRDGVVLYVPTEFSKRENFTLAHELGHLLVDSVEAIYDWVADQDDPARLLETICDRIAQRLLLPEGMITAAIGAGPVRVQTLLDLIATSEASGPACAIALASHLPGLGAVVIIERSTRRVTHASIQPDPEHGWPRVLPWNGDELTSTHPLAAVAPGASVTRRVRWSTPWGQTAEFYADARGDARRVLAILSATDLWNVEQFHAKDDRDFDNRPLLSGICCGTSFERRGYPCPDCEKPYCPKCALCPCQRNAARDVTCAKCFLTFRPHLVVDGLCADCR